MFRIDNKIIQMDTPFELNGVRYPSNWLRLSSDEEKKALGLELVVVTPSPDPQFYDVFADGSFQPKSLSYLQKEWIADIDRQAFNYLKNTDWLVVRSVEKGRPISPEIKKFRDSVRNTASTLKDRVSATKDVEELRRIVMEITWPQEPNLIDPHQPPRQATNFQVRAVLDEMPGSTNRRTLLDDVNSWAKSLGGPVLYAWDYSPVLAKDGVFFKGFKDKFLYSNEQIDQILLRAVEITG